MKNNKEELKEYHKEYNKSRYERDRDKLLAQKRIYDNKNKEYREKRKII
jgi:hypothetical protein